MDAIIKRVRDGQFHWYYTRRAENEDAVRRGIVIRSPERGGWWATVAGHAETHKEQGKGWGRSKKAAIGHAEEIVFGYTVSGFEPPPPPEGRWKVG